MKLGLLIQAVLVLVWALSTSLAQTFQHPGVLVSQSQLDYITTQVAAKTEPFYTAYQKALSSYLTSQTYKPQGPPASGIINYDGCTDDNNDASAAYLQALLWVITKNQQYATNSIALLNSYAANLKQFNNSNAPLQAAWSGLKWTRAAEIIRHSNAGWNESDIEAYENLLLKVYLPLIYDGSGANGNWELSMIEAMLGIAVFTEDWGLFNHSVAFWKQRVPAYFYYEPWDGSKPNPPPRGYPTWYGQSVYNSSVNGICQETCRDLAHTQMGIASCLNAAETAHIQGVDLYDLQGLRIMAALEFNANLLMGAPVPKFVCNGTVTVVQQPTLELGYNQYHNRSGFTLPHTWAQISTHVRTMDDLGDGLISVWETLTHGGSPSA